MYQGSRVRRPVPKPRRRSLGWLLILVIVVVGTLGSAVWRWQVNNSHTTKSMSTAPSFDKKQYSLDDPTSPWVVVNKKRPLSPSTYTPPDLTAPNIALRGSGTDPNMQVRAETATALEKLVAAAKSDGNDLMLASGYRSYDSQTAIYASEVRGYGQEQADRESARAGHSEHQTGWAADLAPANEECVIEACFADTPEGKWLAANAYKYGFILRYAPGKEAVTGYNYEPWHVRYVGTDLATEMHRKGIQTLEEFFGLPSAPSY